MDFVQKDGKPEDMEIQRQEVVELLVHCADIGNPAMPPKSSWKWKDRVIEECCIPSSPLAPATQDAMIVVVDSFPPKGDALHL